MELYPLRFEPIFKERIWGGRRLAEVYGKKLPHNVKIGESWELADLPEDKSRIVNGTLAGQTIDQVIARYGSQITGKTDYTPPLPLLIKILDAQDMLSVQVHPDAQACKRMDKGNPKTECWYILDAAPGAMIYKGLKPGTTKEQFTEAIKAGTTAELLNKIVVKAGQCHLLPSGTCHAIGAGLLIAEIQQPSDTTYRVFDWNRVGPDGKGRELHIEEALDSIHFNSSGDQLTVNTVGRLVDTAEFIVDKGHQTPGCEVLMAKGTMRAIMIITGGGQLIAEDMESEPFSKGDTFLVPAAWEGVMQFAADTEYLVATV
ncbi:MAG: class I mannose-6-phosphate isomerase [Sedimentisphaerales bacterium]|nr:class I mannose-6-phosphate isomerase [Sedimentisphaerales bacterium]